MKAVRGRRPLLEGRFIGENVDRPLAVWQVVRVAQNRLVAPLVDADVERAAAGGQDDVEDLIVGGVVADKLGVEAKHLLAVILDLLQVPPEIFRVVEAKTGGLGRGVLVLVEPVHQGAAHGPLPAFDPLGFAEQVSRLGRADQVCLIMLERYELSLQLRDGGVFQVLHQMRDDIGPEADDELGLLVPDQPFDELVTVPFFSGGDARLGGYIPRHQVRVHAAVPTQTDFLQDVSGQERVGLARQHAHELAGMFFHPPHLRERRVIGDDENAIPILRTVERKPIFLLWLLLLAAPGAFEFLKGRSAAHQALVLPLGKGRRFGRKQPELVAWFVALQQAGGAAFPV
jgi:hypothetical protein